VLNLPIWRMVLSMRVVNLWDWREVFMSKITARDCFKNVSLFCALGVKRFACIFSFFFFLAGIAEGYAQSRLLLAWDLPAVSGSTTSSVGSGFNDSSVLANNITLGSGITVNNNSTAWGGTSWTALGTGPIANGTGNNDYTSFRVIASASDRVTITGVFRLVIQVSGSGPKYWSLLYSSVNTDAAFANPERNFGPFEVSTVPISGSTVNTEITAGLSVAIAASPIVLEPSAVGYFRLVGYGGATGSGSGRIVSSNTGVITPDFGIMGTSVVSYVPKSLVWNGSSGAAWNSGVTTDLFWLNGSTSTYFNNGDSATFNGNASVSVASTGVTTPLMTNNPVAGETQTFTGSPINCQLLLTKSGSGTLVFTPAPDVDQNIYEINQTGGTIRISQSAADSNNNVLGGPRWTMASNTVFDMGNSSYEIIRQLTGFGTIQMTNVIANTNANNTNAFVANNDIHLRNTSNSVFGGSFQGVGQLTIDNGTITFTGTNTYSGGTWMSNAATLRLSSQASLPVQTQKSIGALGLDGNPYYTNGVFEVVDLRLSRADSTGVMGTLELDDTLVTSLILSNSIGSTRTADKFRVSAGTNNSYTLQLNGPINLMGNLAGYNASDTPGYVILRGTNQIQELNSGVILERGGRILVDGPHCLYQNKDFGTWAPISFLDTSGYARFGLAPEVVSQITLSNEIYAITNSTTANRHAAILLSTNSINGAPQVLRLAGIISGVGGLRLASPGTGDMGHLYLSAGNRYEGGTRIGTGKLFVPSADALGNAYSLKPASIAFIRFETRSDSYLVPTDNIDFPESHSIAITDDAMANIDTGTNNVVLQGFITNSSSTNLVGGSLRKVGAGKLILSGTNYYTGPTRITEGVLEIVRPASLPANGPLQFGPAGSLKLGGVGNYGASSISPVVITNSTGPTNTETMNGVLNLATNGVNVTVSQLLIWPSGSRLTVANLTNGSVTLPTAITNTPSQLAMIKSAENPTYVASVASNGLLSFAPANLKLTPIITVTPAVGGYTYVGSMQGPGVSEVNTGGSTGEVTLSYAGTGSTSYGSSSTPPTSAGTYTVTAMVAADSTYNQASSSPTAFTIAKATPTVSVAPTASAVTVGALLSSSTLSGGTASVGGTFAWTDSSGVVNATASYPVTFIPTDGANYNTASSTASVTANPAGTTFGSWSGNAAVTQDLVSRYAFGAADKNSAPQNLSSSITSTTLSVTAVVRTDDPHLVITPKSVNSLIGTWSATEPIISVVNAADQTGLGTGLVRKTYSVERGIASNRFLKLEAVYTP
jgi:autotransporter-associated beta strand protein